MNAKVEMKCILVLFSSLLGATSFGHDIKVHRRITDNAAASAASYSGAAYRRGRASTKRFTATSRASLKDLQFELTVPAAPAVAGVFVFDNGLNQNSNTAPQPGHLD